LTDILVKFEIEVLLKHLLKSFLAFQFLRSTVHRFLLSSLEELPRFPEPEHIVVQKIEFISVISDQMAILGLMSVPFTRSTLNLEHLIRLWVLEQIVPQKTKLLLKLMTVFIT